MTGARRRRAWVLIALVGGLSACSNRPSVETLPTPEETLANAGLRLSRMLAPGDLTELAARGDRVLGSLTRVERDALARGALRFRLDRSATVLVAAPPDSPPFWLSDLGFHASGETIRVEQTGWPLFALRCEPGWVGLGVNALDLGASAHYAVFVRPDGPGTVALSERDRPHWRLARAEVGGSVASGVSWRVTSLPKALAGSVLLQPTHDRRHATCLASGRVWKTHVVSGRAPDQVAIAFGADPTSSLVWTWRTGPDVSASAVRLREPGGAGRVVEGESHPVASPNLLNDPLIRRHVVRVEGLAPGSAYGYALGDGSPGGWSEWRTVRTAPARAERFALLYLGDAQCGLEGWGRLLHRALERRPDVGAILLAGDLVDRGNERTNWDHFFLRAAGVFDRVPLMPAVGNHEYLDQGPRLYRACFDLPKNGPAGVDPGLVYSFEYGNAFIAVLDSTLAVSSPEHNRLQAEWLDSALARTSATWKLVMFHHPVYASHPTRENPALQAWVPVFDRQRVDLVLQGHDHAYLRTYPLKAGRRVESPTEGTVYLVAVSGEKFCDQDPRDYTAAGLTHVSTYQTIDIDVSSNRLTCTAWDVDGRAVDQFVLQKAAEPRRELSANSRR